MSITIDVAQINIDSAAIAGKIKHSEPLGRFAATEWHKLYTPYVPWREGVLAGTTGSVDFKPWEIKHTTVYARYQYYGDRFNFYKGRHPKASARWDKAAEGTMKPELIRSIQRYIDDFGIG